MKIELMPFDKAKDAEELAAVYAKVFAGDPWNEVTRCPIVPGQFFGAETQPGQLCPSCLKLETPRAVPLEEAYPKDELIPYFAEETSRDGAFALVGRPNEGPNRGRIVAFTWMYNYPDARTFVLDKYKIPQGDIPGLRFQVRLIRLLQNSGVNGKFGYFSESGILPEYRGNGLSNEFWERRVEITQAQGIPAIQRTRWDSPMIVVARKFNFEQLLGPRSNRVIKPNGSLDIEKTNEVANGFIDQINPNRVLFRSPR